MNYILTQWSLFLSDFSTGLYVAIISSEKMFTAKDEWLPAKSVYGAMSKITV